jgi:hypothetical protein
MYVCCRLLFFLSFSGNLALCDAFNNLRIDEWRKFKAKDLLITDVSRMIALKENLLNGWLTDYSRVHS